MFRDPRAKRNHLEKFLEDKLDVIPKYLEMISEGEKQASLDLTELRELSRIYFDALKLSYSLGAEPKQLRVYLDPAVDWYVEYERKYHQKRVDSNEPVLTWDDMPIRLIDAAQLLSVVILIGTPEQRARISGVLEPKGPETILEFLAGLHGDSIDGIDVSLSSPRPYGRLLKVIQAEPSKRPRLMAEFLKHWYSGCRKASWWGQYERGVKYERPVVYSGYWCFEAAAVTQLLGIDDTLYRENEYYPRDIFIDSV